MSGAAYAAFRSALLGGDVERIQRTARNLPEVRLQDALEICVAYARQPELYERAAIRWVGRFCAETRNLTLDDVREATTALVALPRDTETSRARLGALVAKR